MKVRQDCPVRRQSGLGARDVSEGDAMSGSWLFGSRGVPASFAWGLGGGRPVTAAAVGLWPRGRTRVGDSNWGDWDPRGRLGVSSAAGGSPQYTCLYLYIWIH